MLITLRPLTASDAEAFAELLTRNRAHFQASEPTRPNAFYTQQFQQQRIRDAEDSRRADVSYMYAIEFGTELVGSAYLNSVIRGALQSASVAYAVDRAHSGRGIGTGALQQLIRIAFDELGLHRLQGETLVENLASQRVLAKCGFEHYGTAPNYLRIAGSWRTHELFQLTNDNWNSSTAHVSPRAESAVRRSGARLRADAVR